MTTIVKGTALTKTLLGLRVDRATANLPQTTQSALFTVATAPVIITGIVGTVTTVIQTQANNTKLVANPTSGTDVDLCAVLSITAKEVGTLFGITGLFSDAMVGVAAGAGVLMRNPVVVNVGTIDLNCAASNTGQVKWSIWYVPMNDSGGVVTAA